ncbi:glycosyltransferase family 4 protein [Pseudanabaena sp. FACHB-2040]|uniref:glycosyltransferase family 4 protein n=1 Tax=Pseudanabaena sp. FACHB-2040 TaxID=2692859 RepID=UPI001685C70C|nr:glycosyltransferase family 4 protein [Pseudanabaena sp. FACHB-2040]MBD2256762.1 glycosyltransferase family 4 protein [Pseudanabaena sp. FACHB-2040]
MHIIVLENEPSTQRGGQELSLLDVCRGLAQRGHRLTLLYRSPGDLLAEYQTFCHSAMLLRQYRIEMRQPLTSSWQLVNDLRRVAVEPPGLVYSNQYHDSFAGLVLSQLKGVPFVCHLRLPPPPALGWQWSLGMKRARRLIAVSQQTREEWVKRGFAAEQIDVVYNGIDSERFMPAGEVAEMRSHLNLPPDKPLVCYVGRLDPTKGLETLLRAVQRIAPTVHLAIAGKSRRPDYLTVLKTLVRDLGLEQQVTFLGHVSQPQQVYGASDLMVLPSEWPEPFGRSLIEAMACGIPVIGSRIGGIPEVLTGPLAENLVEAGNAAALAQRIQQLAQWRHHDPGLGQRCRDYAVSQFSLVRTLDGVESSLVKAATHN